MPTGTLATAPRSPRRGGLVAWFVTLAAPLLILLVVGALAVDLPRWDEWEYTPFLVKAAHGNATAADLFAQYNESRVAVGRLVLLAFAFLTNWNLRAQSLVAPVFAGITLLLLALVGRASVRERGPAWKVALALTSLFLFSPTQDDNWMMPLQFIAFVPSVCLAGVLYLAVTSVRWWIRWGLAVLLCVIATFSVPNGLVLWVLAWPALWWPLDRAQQRMRTAGLALWTAIGLLTLAYFFRGFTRVQAHGSAVTPIADPALFSWYVVTFLGAPFSRGTAFDAVSIAPILGALLLVCLAIAVAWMHRTPVLRRAALPWLLLSGFALSQAAAGAALRAQAGLLQALPSRYATYSLALPVSLAWLAALAWTHLAETRRPVPAPTLHAGTAIVAAMLTLLALSSAEATREMRALSRSLLVARAALPFLGHVDDTRPLERLYPRLDLLPALAAPLWELRWLRPPHRASAELPAEGDDPEPGNGGRLEQGAISDGKVTLEGWAIAPARNAPADLVVIAWHDETNRAYADVFATKRSEPKVYLGPPGDPRRLSGWTAVVDTRAIPRARRLSAWGLDGRSGRAYRLHGNYELPSVSTPDSSSRP